MNRTRYFLLLFLLLPYAVLTQTSGTSKRDISISDFRGTMSFLASGWMEGREAGEKGSFMASDYIAAMMETSGLEPYGDSLIQADQNYSRTYFQNFTLVRNITEEATLSISEPDNVSKSENHFSYKTEFNVEPGTRDFSAECPVVFAGYGISLPENGYDDYSNMDVRNNVVIVLPDFPGYRDMKSVAWQKIGKKMKETDELEYEKRMVAQEKGAVAIIEICDPEFNENIFELGYLDYLLMSPADTALSGISVIKMKSDAVLQLLEGSGIDLPEVEAKAAGSLKSSSSLLRNRQCRISISMKQEVIRVRNVLGIIYGKDSARQIIIGAHYDHLGKRDTLIYYGADDNASGTAGMLALAKHWTDKKEQPPCNLVFAGWTAEEEGMLGSTFNVAHRHSEKNNTSLYVNLDMISRSDPTDTLQTILSVGTLKDSESLKTLINKQNSRLEKPFQLDLWQCDENGDSDYAPFVAKDIPVMTFFSGFHDDYHTPRDVVQKVDFEKMKNVLNLVDDCLDDFLQTLQTGNK